MTTIAVIIPYFQKRPGILRRALTSVLQQRLPADIRVEVIVVDDGSPVPAQAEAEGLHFESRHFESPFHLTIVNQPNSGVASARNTGLRNVPEGTTYIAFLDSDDIWDPEHLPRAVRALSLGYDYYFCDSRRIRNEISTFAEGMFDILLTPANAMPMGDGFHDLDKEMFIDFSIRNWVSLVPTIVYRRSVAPGLLFDTSLRIAGEDCLFLFKVLEKCSRICCSSQCLVTVADGINIHSGTYNWDNPANFMRSMGQIIAFYEYRKQLTLSVENDRVVAGQIKDRKKHFAFHTLRYFLKKRERWPAELVTMTRHDSTFWRWYPLYALYMIVCYPLGLYDPLKQY